MPNYSHVECELQDDAGNLFDDGVQVRWFDLDALVYPAIYADRAGTVPKGNPFAIAPGTTKVSFYTPGGRYRLDLLVDGSWTTIRTDFGIGTARELDVEEIAGLVPPGAGLSGQASLTDYGGNGNGIALNDAAWSAIFADPSVYEIYVPEGTYLYGNSQADNVVPNRIRRIWGPGQLKFGGTFGGANTALQFENFTGNIIIEQLTFDQVDMTGLQPIIFATGNCSNIEVRRCRFIKGYWIWLFDSFSAVTYTNCKFVDNVVEDFAQGCIAFAGGGLASSVKLRVNGNRITGINSGYHCLGIETNNAAATHQDCEVIGNTINTLGASSQFAIMIANANSSVGGCVIANNVVNSRLDGIHVDARGTGGLSYNWSIIGNRVYATNDGGIFAEASQASCLVRNGHIGNNHVVRGTLGISCYAQGASSTVKHISVQANMISCIGIPSGASGIGILLIDVPGTAIVNGIIVQGNCVLQTDSAGGAVMEYGIRESGVGANGNIVMHNLTAGYGTAGILLTGGSSQSIGNV